MHRWKPKSNEERHWDNSQSSAKWRRPKNEMLNHGKRPLNNVLSLATLSMERPRDCAGGGGRCGFGAMTWRNGREEVTWGQLLLCTTVISGIFSALPAYGDCTPGYVMRCKELLPVSYWIDEIKTTMHSVVDNVSSIQTRFVCKIWVVLFVDIVHNGIPAEER